MQIELKEEDEDIFRTAEELGLDLGVEDDTGKSLGQATALDRHANIKRVRRKPEPASPSLGARSGPNLVEIAHEQYHGVKGSGVNPDELRATYCQGGIRAALAWFALSEIAGLTQVRNYAESWEEWGNRPDLPVEQ